MAEPPKQGRRLTVLSDAAGVDPGTPLQAPFEAPALRRFSTPDCMSSPVSYLRDMTHGLEEGVRRERAVQFLLESRLAHLQQRRLYLVLDLDETLVHSLRSSCLLYTSPSPRDGLLSRMPSSA